MTDDSEQRQVVKNPLIETLDRLSDFGIQSGANRADIWKNLAIDPERNYVFTRTVVNPAAVAALEGKRWGFDEDLAKAYLNVLHRIAEVSGLVHTTYPLNGTMEIMGKAVHIIGDAGKEISRCDSPLALRKRFEDLVVGSLGIATAEYACVSLKNSARLPELLFLKTSGIRPFNVEYNSTVVSGVDLERLVHH